MHNHHNREISIEKSKLIEKIKENRDIHIKEYEEAVIAYKKEEFIKKLGNDEKYNEWNTAFTVLFSYKMKNK